MGGKGQFLFLDSLPFWENERARIASGELNYERTIKRELLRLQKVREDFMNMDDTTY